MIISASYRTDIPTFYGEWFMRRLRAGYCKVTNPYSQTPYRVALDPGSVQGIVFWTKNLGPFLKHLPEVKDRGYPFVVQYTINGYPRPLETSVVDSERSVEHAWALRETYGPKVLVWRYDTIVTSTLTPADFHISNFERLARAMVGVSDEVVISFAHIYRKTKRNLDEAARSHGFEWTDPSAAEKQALVSRLAKIAKDCKFQLTICSQSDYLTPGVEEARCVDARRFETIVGGKIAAKIRGNRAQCGCYESKDVGDYNTCPHGCVYCYAVEDRKLSLERYRLHDPDSEFLFMPPSDTVDDGKVREVKGKTLPLFPR